ncbi:MAG TPA: hypothetical protein ENJ84_02995 [Gammaproteobacteria bacterium]|nr:hypothetical protein [Gammaproteobacteria bacterium]
MKDHEKPADHSTLDSEGEAHRTVFRVAGDGGYGWARLWSTDLTPLPVQHLDDIISAYETLQPTIKMQRLHIMVPPSS